MRSLSNYRPQRIKKKKKNYVTDCYWLLLAVTGCYWLLLGVTSCYFVKKTTDSMR